jgi:protein-S-isoprenylcysteine O-methyltransferase Ste14
MSDQTYGLWPLVLLNSGLLIIFAASFFHPRSGRDWRAMGAFSAFLVALFTEMYGVPLTVYLLSGWLGDRIPALEATHAGGHLWNDLIGWTGDPHLSPFHLASYLAIGGGFWLMAAAWRVLWEAARSRRLATSGAYAHVRHPQYVGLLLVMVGFLLQWPTIPTLMMFPVLVWVYRRLALAEEREVAARFGPAWADYAARTPRFLPWPRHRTPGDTPGTSGQPHRHARQGVGPRPEV